MRRLYLAITTSLVLLGVSSVSPAAASASGTTFDPPSPPVRETGAVTSRPTAPVTGLRSPAVVAPATVVCDGNFNVVASPNGTGHNYLNSVAATNANDVWAVGTSTSTNGYDRTLAMHWNGTSWTKIPTPNPGTLHNDPNGVTAISTNDVWAVGYYQVNSLGYWNTFALHWNGTSWTLNKLTRNPTPYSFLFAVTAISTNDVWAVGTFNSAGWLPLIEHWNGTSWSQVASPQPSPTNNKFWAVSAWSATDVWAVGEWSGTGTGPTPLQSLAAHWDGSTWSLITTPNQGASGNNAILGVSALEAGHAVGVGFGDYILGSVPRKGVAWDLLTGSTSTAQYESGPGAGDNALLGVARSGAGVQAVGYWRNTATSARQTLAIPATWNSAGHSLTWSSVGTSASPSTINNALFGVAAVSPHVFWAIGYSTKGTVDQTLTELYCGLHFNLSAPAMSTPGSPFALTVTATNANSTTATTYVGTVHFTTTDSLAVLPADYSFTPGDSGTHTFSGVVLNSLYRQTITAKDVATPFVLGSTTVLVVCRGACQGPASTPGGRGVLPGPTASPAPRAPNQSPGGSPGPRTPWGLVFPLGLVAFALSARPRRRSKEKSNVKDA